MSVREWRLVKITAILLSDSFATPSKGSGMAKSTGYFIPLSFLTGIVRNSSGGYSYLSHHSAPCEVDSAQSLYRMAAESLVVSYMPLHLSRILCISLALLSSWPYEIIYFWLLGQVLCEAQRREHSRSYVTGVVTKHSA